MRYRGVRWMMAVCLILGLMMSIPQNPAASAGQGADRSDPVPIGSAATIGDYSVSVLDVTPNANEIIAAENQFNDPPKEGRQFLIARVSITYTGSDSGTPTFDLGFKAVGSRDVAYTTFDDSCGVVPEGLNDAPELFEGGEVEVNLCWSVETADVDSLLMYVEPLLSFDEDRIWFSLGNEAGKPVATPGSAASSRTVVERSSRNDPIPVGSVGVVGDYEISVIGVTADATAVILEANQFNEEPAPGNQFFLARVMVTYVGKDTGHPTFDLNFQAVGSLNTGYSTFENGCGVTPESSLDVSDVFPGGTVEYNVCWQIASQDADSLVMYVEPLMRFDDDRVWFSLDASAADTTASEPATPDETNAHGSTVELTAMDITFQPKELTIPANADVTITIINQGVLQHGFVIEREGIDSGPVERGESADVVVNLSPGTYQFRCSTPGHREAGMVGTLIVE